MAGGPADAPAVAIKGWGEVGVRPPARGHARTVLPGSLVPLVVAGLLLAAGRASAAGVVVVAGVVTAQLTALRWRPWLRLVDGIGTGVGAALRLLALGVVFVAVLVPLWLLGRAVRYDPLAITTRGPGVRPARSTRPFARERSTFPRRRRVVAGAGVAVLAVLVAVVVVRWPRSEAVPAAHRAVTTTHSLIAHQGDLWAPELFAEEGRAGNRFDPYLTMRLSDFHGRYLNIEDDERSSHRHAGPADDDVDVWFFGGSTMFGVGQRDGHTIASDIVRLAERDGIPVRAHNFGVSSYVNWQETILFLELLQRRPHPDLVVFYDGANDATVDMRDGVVDEPSTYFAPDAERALVDEGAFLLPPDDPDDHRSELQRVQGFLRIYGAGVATSRQAAVANGLAIRHYFQPVLGTKRPMTDADAAAYRVVGGAPAQDQRRWDVIRSQPLPEGEVDLRSVLDEVLGPLYFDQVHTNELGAEIVAEAMYADLQPELARLAGGGRQ